MALHGGSDELDRAMRGDAEHQEDRVEQLARLVRELRPAYTDFAVPPNAVVAGNPARVVGAVADQA